jgi:hypothetical protein
MAVPPEDTMNVPPAPTIALAAEQNIAAEPPLEMVPLSAVPPPA